MRNNTNIKVKNTNTKNIQDMTDWDQVIMRNVRNTPLPDSRNQEIVTSVIVGPDCEKPLSFRTPFLQDTTTGASVKEQGEAVLKNRERYGEKSLVRYSSFYRSPRLLNRDCILELDGPEIDMEILKTMNIGAFFVNLADVYSELSWHDNPAYYMKIIEGIEFPLHGRARRIIDFSRFYKQGSPVVQWIYSLRRLRPDIPFGIRVPANYIERDCVIAATCDVDFIIFDCPDAVMDAGYPNAIVRSLPALSRVHRIFSKLCDKKISVITGIPPIKESDFLKLFAMGSDLLMFSYQGDANNDAEMGEDIGFVDLNSSLNELKQALYRCGCEDLNEAGKEHLLTGSPVIGSSAGISMMYDADPVILPFFSTKKVDIINSRFSISKTPREKV